VRRFGKTEVFRRSFRPRLDRRAARLRRGGFADASDEDCTPRPVSAPYRLIVKAAAAFAAAAFLDVSGGEALFYLVGAACFLPVIALMTNSVASISTTAMSRQTTTFLTKPAMM